MDQLQLIDKGNMVGLRLTVPDRQLVLGCDDGTLDATCEERIRETPDGQLVLFTLDELDKLYGSLADEANNTPIQKRRKGLNRILRRIEALLDTYTDDEDSRDDPGDDLPQVTSPAQLMREIFGGAEVEAEGPSLPAIDCRVSFTKVQRETLAGMDTLSGDILKLLAGGSKGERQLTLNPRQVIVMSLAVREALHQTDDRKQLRQFRAVAERISDGMYNAIQEAAEFDFAGRYRASQTQGVAVAFQLKVSLEGSKPPIWRQIHVADCTLDVLHEIIQVAMGWENYHMHMFEWGKDRFSHPSAELGEGDYNETQVLLSQLVAAGCKKLRYWYDFGDDWWHTIKIEKALKPSSTDRFPLCIDGAGACPPEDCGGVWGYYEFLDAIREPKHEQHEELLEWIGGEFDPEKFDPDDVNQELAC